MPIRAVFFDVGETLIDESRMWRIWADYLGVSYETFIAELEAVIGRGEHHRRVFDRFRPGFDLVSAQQELDARSKRYRHEERDLYPDACPCLDALRRSGCFVGIAGNQPREARDELTAMRLGVDAITTSAELGAEKPSALFFARLAQLCGLPPREIAYVGDRVDNDIVPVKTTGMAAIFLVRGPWGRVHASQANANMADVRITSLADVPAAIARIGGR